jgi:hypothetical protein
MITALRHPCPHELTLPHVRPGDADLVHDEDFQLALWISFELAYRGFDDVDDTWEWAPSLITSRDPGGTLAGCAAPTRRSPRRRRSRAHAGRAGRSGGR